MKPAIQVVQCWDDAVEDDIRLCELLRAHGAKASFNINSGLHGPARGGTWRYRDSKDVRRLAMHELVPVYDGFTIANHTVSHPRPLEISLDAWRREVVDGRKQLQDLFQQPVLGFAYPYGQYDPETAGVVSEAGHIYARTCENATPCHPASDRFRQPTDCHFASPDFWIRLDEAKSAGSHVFYFWGHSYEMMTEEDWRAFDEKLTRLAADPEVVWAELPDIFSS